MSDWIDRADKDLGQIEQDTAHRDSSINLSNYWASLRVEVERCVVRINSAPHLSKHLISPVIVDDLGASYRVEAAAGNHAVKVFVTLMEGQVALLIETYGQGEPSSSKEFWAVSDTGAFLILKRGDEELIVPKQAAEHILRPVVKMLRLAVERP